MPTASKTIGIDLYLTVSVVGVQHFSEYQCWGFLRSDEINAFKTAILLL